MRKTVPSGRALLLAALAPLALGLSGARAQESSSIVHAVLFYSSTCPHCHQVITEVLIPLQNQYAGRLRILGFETSSAEGTSLYWQFIRQDSLPQEDWVVPILVVGEQTLIGGNEISGRFPSIVQQGLASGGIDLPDFPALIELLGSQGLLDPRFPDRRILRRASPSEDTPPPSRGDPLSAPDSAAAVEADSGGAAAADTGGAVAVDTAAAVEADSGGAVAVDTAAAVEADSGGAVAVDTAGAVAVDTAAAPEAESAVVARADSVATADSLPPARGDSVGEAAAADRARAGVESAARGDIAGGRDSVVTAAVRDSLPVEADRDSVSAGGVEGAEGIPPGGGVPGTALDLEAAVREMESMTLWDRFTRDRAGNSLAVLVLAVLLGSLALRGYPPRVKGGEWPVWVLPGLAVVGASIAAYLSFVELTHTEAVCGPVGDCNTVNQSEYAFLFGILPVGVLGLMGYGLITALWLIARLSPGGRRAPATIGLWALAATGTAFSVYLTFLEPFVIGATCAWCLTSSVIMALLLWVTAPMAARAWPAVGAATGPG